MTRKIEYPKSRLFNILQSSVALYFGIYILLNASVEEGRHWGWLVAVVGLGGIVYNGYRLFMDWKTRGGHSVNRK